MTASSATPPTTPPKPRVHTVDEAVDRIVKGFHRRYEAQPELRRRLKGKDRIFLLDVTDGKKYTFHMVDGRLEKVEDAHHPKPDVRVSVATADLIAVVNKDLRAIEAYLTGRIKIRASLSDMLFAKSVIG